MPTTTAQATHEPSTRAQTISVLALALVLRLIVITIILLRYPKGWLFTRGIEMDLLAKSLLAGLGLASPFGGATGPTAFIAPAFPIFVAAVYRVLGTASVVSATFILLIHVAANVTTVWLILHVARRLFDNATALTASILWAVSPPLLFIPTIFWDTSFSICLLLGLIALALHYRDHPSLHAWIFLGAYCGVFALLNSAMVFVLAAILGWLAWQTRTQPRSHLLCAALTFVLVFSPWPIRNARVFHAFIPLRTTAGFELWMGNHDGANGFLNESIFPMYNRAELDQYIQLGEVAYTTNKTHLAETYILQHPTIFLNLTTRRIFRFWTGTGTQHGSPVFALQATLTSLFGFAALVTLYRKHRRSLVALFALPLLLFPIPYYITHAEFRYRLVIDPLMTILAAYTLTHLFKAHNHTPTPHA